MYTASTSRLNHLVIRVLIVEMIWMAVLDSISFTRTGTVTPTATVVTIAVISALSYWVRRL